MSYVFRYCMGRTITSPYMQVHSWSFSQDYFVTNNCSQTISDLMNGGWLSQPWMERGHLMGAPGKTLEAAEMLLHVQAFSCGSFRKGWSIVTDKLYEYLYIPRNVFQCLQTNLILEFIKFHSCVQKILKNLIPTRADN